MHRYRTCGAPRAGSGKQQIMAELTHRHQAPPLPEPQGLNLSEALGEQHFLVWWSGSRLVVLPHHLTRTINPQHRQNAGHEHLKCFTTNEEIFRGFGTSYTWQYRTTAVVNTIR